MPEYVRPRHYESLVKNYPGFMSALEAMAQAARQCGPLDDKTLHLVQLGAATALGCETAVVSHARRAVQAGASPVEVAQALLALATTIGFPAVAAGLKWSQKYLDE
jgi:4-carboxymuconolactone decarboxylase